LGRLFNVLHLPQWLTVPVGVLLLDLAIYVEHVLLHWELRLWRFHCMHHADLEHDVTMGVSLSPRGNTSVHGHQARSHSRARHTGPGGAWLRILLSASPLFNHGNVGLPEKVDRALRWVLVTPDMHRLHHSIVRRETNSNFGF
jgi:sterol desaturase/sphingolipid hydroxylase (fatty acid hydroxylase superfamily)